MRDSAFNIEINPPDDDSPITGMIVVDELHRSLNDPGCRTEAAETLRGIIESINVGSLGRGAFEMELTGEIANMIDLASSDIRNATTAPEGAAVPDAYRSSVKMVAGARYQRCLHLDHAVF